MTHEFIYSTKQNMDSTIRKPREIDRTVGAVECAMEILRCFHQTSLLRLHDIHELTGLNKSRILRTAGTLIKFGFLKLDPATKAYALGPIFLSLAGTLAPAVDRIKRAAQPILEALTAEIGETTMLSTATGEERVVIVRAEPELGLRYGVAVGQRRSLFHGATGTILLAHLGAEIDSAKLWPKIKTFAENTYASPGDFDKAILKARQDGFAISQRGNAFALAVPIFFSGETTALTVVGPLSEMNNDRSQKLRGRLIEASEKIRSAVISLSKDTNP
ncbi:MAG: IclR family transcriptional regulator [Burkholderiaceae bacterium]|nr:IclR family transcriptional regulator [Burkholderiaceae bacterium]